MYEFSESATEDDKTFFGYNEGTPWLSPNSSGMLDAKYNVMNYPCNENNRTSPYFEEFSTTKYPKYKDQNDYLQSVIKNFSNMAIVLMDRNLEFPE